MTIEPPPEAPSEVLVERRVSAEPPRRRRATGIDRPPCPGLQPPSPAAATNTFLTPRISSVSHRLPLVERARFIAERKQQLLDIPAPEIIAPVSDKRPIHWHWSTNCQVAAPFSSLPSVTLYLHYAQDLNLMLLSI